MRIIGICGGISPISTIEYYRLITGFCLERKLNYPVIIIYSLNSQEMVSLMRSKKYSEFIERISMAVNSLAKAGADFALIASNTPHVFFHEIQKKSSITLLSIVEATAKEVSKLDLRIVGLMGTRFTMQSDFYRKELSKLGIDVVVPGTKEQEYIHEKIMDELVKGQINERTRQKIVSITKKMMREDRIEGLTLGCTELQLISPAEYVNIPIFDTTGIHVMAALEYALAK